MLTIREAEPDDLADVIGVFHACWTLSYAAFATQAQLDSLTLSDIDRMWADAWTRNQGLVAILDGRLVGLTRFSWENDRTLIQSLYVHPQAQGHSIGVALLNAALNSAEFSSAAVDGTTRGTAAVIGSPTPVLRHRGQLWVFAANQRARRFYTAQGWRPDGLTRTEERFGMPEISLVNEPPAPDDAMASRLVSREVCLTATEQPPGGCVIGVDDHIVAAGVRGPNDEPMLPETWHDLASVSKLFTTCALMSLVSQGRIALNTPVGSVLGEFNGWAATIGDVAAHRSGLLAWQPLYLRAHDPTAALTLIRRLLAAGSEPGPYRYSDLGFMILGEIIATVAGEPLDKAMHDLVCAPLGLGAHYVRDSQRWQAQDPIACSARSDQSEQVMVRTGEPYPILISGRQPTWATKPLVGVVNDGNARRVFAGVAGHAGIFGRLNDLLILGQTLANPDRYEMFWQPSVVRDFLDSSGTEQAVGFRVHQLPSGQSLYYHPGFTGCMLGFVAGKGHAIAMATNRLLNQPVAIPTDRLWKYLLANWESAKDVIE